MSSPLNDAWLDLRKINKSLDMCEARVRKENQRGVPAGRELPFFISEKMVFSQGEFEPQEATLVLSAERLTKIVELKYSVSIAATFDNPADPPDFPQASLGLVFGRQLRPTPRGMWMNFFADTPQTAIFFDFEWTFRLGNTERHYSNGIIDSSEPYQSRAALGNPELDSNMLFSQKNPLVLESNQFLTMKIRPTLFNSDVDLTTQGANEVSPAYIVEVTGKGYRTMYDG